MELREFKYKTHDEIKERKLYVIQENERNVAGLDKNLLPESEIPEVEKVLENHQIQPLGSKTPIEGWKPEWGKAWRNFTKANFIKDKVIKES